MAPPAYLGGANMENPCYPGRGDLGVCGDDHVGEADPAPCAPRDAAAAYRTLADRTACYCAYSQPRALRY